MNIKVTLKKFIHIARNRVYKINGKKRVMNHFGTKSGNVEMWYENVAVKEFVENMPYKKALLEIFGSYQYFGGKKVRYLFVLDDRKVNDNWYYPDDKVWVLTLFGAIDTLLEILENQKKDTQSLRNYCLTNGLPEQKGDAGQ